MNDIIDSFTGKYDFLSNYYGPCELEYEGRIYRNSEAAYQAQKCRYEDKKDLFTDLSPDEAKNIGKRVALVDGWDDMKAEVMYRIVKSKFEQNGELATRLMETGSAMLVEGNTWHDNFFGACTCEKCAGEQKHNYLGKILMTVRRELWETGIRKLISSC